MTKRKNANAEQYSRLELAQYRLRKLAVDLEDGVAVSASERSFLVAALKQIGRGDDANVVLGVTARRGERKTAAQAAKRDKIRFAMSIIAALIEPREEGGPGMSLEEAIASAAETRPGEARFGLSEETLRTYWGNHPEWRSPAFPRPIASLPDHQRKDD
jgi:hypothetical protein